MLTTAPRGHPRPQRAAATRLLGGRARGCWCWCWCERWCWRWRWRWRWCWCRAAPRVSEAFVCLCLGDDTGHDENKCHEHHGQVWRRAERHAAQSTNHHTDREVRLPVRERRFRPQNRPQDDQRFNQAQHTDTYAGGGDTASGEAETTRHVAATRTLCWEDLPAIWWPWRCVHVACARSSFTELLRRPRRCGTRAAHISRAQLRVPRGMHTPGSTGRRSSFRRHPASWAAAC